MDAVLLQPWLTLSGASSSVTATQSVSDYLDLPGAIDLVFFVQASSVTVTAGVVRVEIQTSSACDESLFRAVLSPVTFDPSGVVSVSKATLKLATVPFARFLRWQVSSTGTGAWSTTFRVYASFSVADCEVVEDPERDTSPDPSVLEDLIVARAAQRPAGTGRPRSVTAVRGKLRE